MEDSDTRSETASTPPPKAPKDPKVKDPKVTVKIPRPLYNKIQILIDDSGFNSPTDFIVYVLRDLVGEHEAGTREGEFSPEELRSIKRKLRNLGYLD